MIKKQLTIWNLLNHVQKDIIHVIVFPFSCYYHSLYFVILVIFSFNKKDKFFFLFSVLLFFLPEFSSFHSSDVTIDNDTKNFLSLACRKLHSMNEMILASLNYIICHLSFFSIHEQYWRVSSWWKTTTTATTAQYIFFKLHGCSFT